MEKIQAPSGALASYLPHGIGSHGSYLREHPSGGRTRDPRYRPDSCVFFDSILDRFETARVEMSALWTVVFHRSEADSSSALVVLASDVPFLRTFEVCLASLADPT